MFKSIFIFQTLTPNVYHFNAKKLFYKYFISIGRNFIRSKEFQEAQAMGLNPDLAAEQSAEKISTKEKQRSIRHKLVSLTLKRKNKMGDEIKKKLQEEEYTADSYNSWLESRYVLAKLLGPDHVQVNWKHKSIGSISQLET